MLTEIDITRRPSYEIGYEKGFEIGFEEGIKLGIAERLLGLLDDAVIAERLGLDIDEVRALHSSGGDEA